MLNPLRRRYRALKARMLGRADPIILMYHRVAALACDPWKLAVTPARFAEQLDLLSRRRTIVPLAWLVAELEAGRVPDRAVALTFDDGYVDVLRNAKPILERFDAPATVYLTTGMIGRRAEFWWDALSRLVLEAPALPATLELALGGRTSRWPTADRAAFHRAVWSALRALTPAEREGALLAITQWAATAAPVAPPREADRALDPDEVRRLATGHLVTIGAHTVSHPSLPLLGAGEQRREMGASRTDCERLLGAQVTAFAYPFGDHDARSVRLARVLGFRHACTTDPGVAVTARERFRLPRMFVDDWGAEELERNVVGTA
jgi:peptidoglycan/xylan/chitin deacetylase (PgdA/CDA1 family)